MLGSSQKIPERNFIDIQVVADDGIGNLAAECLSITNGRDDSICMAGSRRPIRPATRLREREIS